MGNTAKPFEPWRKDRKTAFSLFAFSASCGIAVAALLPVVGRGSLVYVTAAGCVAGGLAGLEMMNRAMRRKHGQELEKVSIERLSKLLDSKDIPYQMNVMAKGLGDIDMIAETPKGPITIEIKSFIKWKSFLFGQGARERKAFTQATRQMERIKGCAGLIWLPNGKPSFLQRIFSPRKGKIKVIFGGPKVVLKTIRKIGF